MDDFYIISIYAGVYVPLIFAVLLALIYPVAGGKAARVLGMTAASVSALASLAVWYGFLKLHSGSPNFAFTSDIADFLPALGVNGISVPFFALAGVVGFVAVYWACISDIKSVKAYMILLLFMQGGLMGVFASTNLLWIYMFHEFALVPTFVATCVWGGAGKRMAAMQMAVYLTLGALVSLVGIIALVVFSGSDGFGIGEIASALKSVELNASLQGWIFALLLFGLGTLVSLFPFYTWAPRGYSAAPTSFSMLHAGVLKKFGLYLLFQVCAPMLPAGLSEWVWCLAVLALFNVLYIGLVTMAQRDLKMMVSYSSVAHMGLCFLGLCSTSILGVGGALILMFGHGLSVALLFMLSNAVVNRTGQWDMRQMGGLYKKTPVLAAFFIAAIFASIGLPGFANFWGELSILVSLWNFSPAICALAALGLIISAIYGLRAVAWVFMGTPSEPLRRDFDSISDLSLRERFPAFVLIAALAFAGFFPWTIAEPVNANLSAQAVYNQSK